MCTNHVKVSLESEHQAHPRTLISDHRRCIDLPELMEPEWRDAADDCKHTLAGAACFGLAPARAAAAFQMLEGLRHVRDRARRAALIELEEEGVVRGRLEEFDLRHLYGPLTYEQQCAIATLCCNQHLIALSLRNNYVRSHRIHDPSSSATAVKA